MQKLFTALTLAAALAVPSLAHAAPPKTFLRDAIKGDNGEISNGTLAERRGASPGVRRFGRMLVRDHTMAKNQAIAAARRERVAVPSGMKPEAAALHHRLMHLRGRSFDHAFVYAMLADHRKDIAKFEAQAKSGDRITSRLARTTLPTLRDHLHMAQSLR